MKMVRYLGLTLGIIGALFAVVACGRAPPTAIVPVGAASGLNTFIYVYSEN